MVTTTTRPHRRPPAEPETVGRLRLVVSHMRTLSALCADLFDDVGSDLATERALTSAGVADAMRALATAEYTLDMTAGTLDAYL